MNDDNPNVSFRIVGCSLYTHRTALKADYHKKRFDKLAYTPVEFKHLNTLATTFIISAGQNQFLQENTFNNAPVHRIAIALNRNSAFSVSYSENPCRYQQFDLTQIRTLRTEKPILDFVSADKFRLDLRTKKSMTLQDDIPSSSTDSFTDHFVLCLS